MLVFLSKYALLIIMISIVVVGTNFVYICMLVIRKIKILNLHLNSGKNILINIDPELLLYIRNPHELLNQSATPSIDINEDVINKSLKTTHIDISSAMNNYVSKARDSSSFGDVLTGFQRDIIKDTMVKYA